MLRLDLQLAWCWIRVCNEALLQQDRWGPYAKHKWHTPQRGFECRTKGTLEIAVRLRKLRSCVPRPQFNGMTWGMSCSSLKGLECALIFFKILLLRISIAHSQKFPAKMGGGAGFTCVSKYQHTKTAFPRKKHHSSLPRSILGLELTCAVRAWLRVRVDTFLPC